MNNLQDKQKSLAHFINFHSHLHASFYNTIDGIISSKDIKGDIENVMDLLRKDCLFIDYNLYINVNEFLNKLAHSLKTGKTVFIFTDTLSIDPLVYDQLMHVREHNSFSTILPDQDLSEITIHPQAKLFLVIKNKGEFVQKISLLTDHILNLEEGDRNNVS
jgi:hypothetical protein